MRVGGGQRMGAWMISGEQQSATTVDHTLHARDRGVAGIDGEHATAVDESNEVLSSKSHGNRSTAEQQVLAIPATAAESPEEDHQSFVLSDEGGSLAGLWYVGYSQGYPYYVHDATGHSQWEDPRPEKHVDSSAGNQTVSQPSDVPSSEAQETARELTTIARDKQHIDLATSPSSPKVPESTQQIENPENSQSWEYEQRLPASPITPVGVTVAVEVPRFVGAHTVPGNANSRCGASNGETEEGAGMPDEEIVDLRQGPLPIERSSTGSRSGSDASSTSSSNSDSSSSTDMDSDTGGEESNRASRGTTPRNEHCSISPRSADIRGGRGDSLHDAQHEGDAIDLWRSRNSSPMSNWDEGSEEVHHESKRFHDNCDTQFDGSEAKEQVPTVDFSEAQEWERMKMPGQGWEAGLVGSTNHERGSSRTTSASETRSERR